jgi:hypothetical protein
MLLIAAGVLVSVLKSQLERLGAARETAMYYENAFYQAQDRAHRLEEAQAEGKRLEEAANEERQALAGTADSGLVERANGLF